MELLDKEQEFWLNLENSFKSKNIIESHEWLSKATEQAKFDQENNILDQIYNVSKYAFKNEIVDEHSIKLAYRTCYIKVL